jgi:hypothetical protein
MKVAFLDFDGVLNSNAHLLALVEEQPPTPEEQTLINEMIRRFSREYHPSVLLHDLRSIDPKAVELLNGLLKASGAKVVISSSWRHVLSTEALRGLLEYHHFKGRILGATPLWVKNSQGRFTQGRGHEIQAWLEGHPRVTQFVILDDDSDMFHLAPHLVKTDKAFGLTEGDVHSALRILGSSTRPTQGHTRT